MVVEAGQPQQGAGEDGHQGQQQELHPQDVEGGGTHLGLAPQAQGRPLDDGIVQAAPIRALPRAQGLPGVVEVDSIKTPVSTATPARAIKPTPTATERLKSSSQRVQIPPTTASGKVVRMSNTS